MKPSFLATTLPICLVILLCTFLISACDDGHESTLATNTAALTGIDSECFDACSERGGDEVTCERACDRALLGVDCYEGCIERGADAETCRATCARDDYCRTAEEADMDRCRLGEAEACYARCVEYGTDEITCRANCYDDMGEEEVECTDGDEAIRDGVTYICQDGEWQELTL